MHIERRFSDVDDIIHALFTLEFESNITEARNQLAEIIIHLRTEQVLRGSYRAERTEAIAGLEEALISMLQRYKGYNFEDIYFLIRECLLYIPKFDVFGINVGDLREIAHDFDAACRYNSVFSSIAADIRKLTHQNLSRNVITKIAAFEIFLDSEKSSALIDGSTVVNATKADKEKLKEMEEYNKLLLLKEKLEVAWSSDSVEQNKLSPEKISEMLREMFENCLKLGLKQTQQLEQFRQEFFPALDLIEKGRWDLIHIGFIRYRLKNCIEEVMGQDISEKGRILFILMTMDSLLEQISFFYYSNEVNSHFSYIDESNYFDALGTLYQLALCTRAVGHGTKHLGRFAHLINRLLKEMERRPDRAAHFPTIVDAMNSELENNLSALQELYLSCLRGKERYTVLNKILNNIIREKTTHLMGTLINNLKTYHSHKSWQHYRDILLFFADRDTFNLNDHLFRFGTDIRYEVSNLAGPEFMSGKGFSLVRTSDIIVKNNIKGIDVPCGIGFSTLTWHNIRGDSSRINDLRNTLREIIAELEKRTGKKFGDAQNPLLLMARSGAVVSMPGILDTISHIGISAMMVDRWASVLDEPVRAWQAYLSFILSYIQSVLDLPMEIVIKASGLDKYGSLYKCDADKLREAVQGICITISRLTWGVASVPEDPFEQLYQSTLAVFRSFENDVVRRQAVTYGIPPEFQTACVIQECLPILSGNDCSGVCFTRNPTTGRIGQIYPEYIEYARGYFGTAIADGTVKPRSTGDFINDYPEHYDSLRKFKYFDERAQRYPTDIEFAVRGGRLFIVQSRALRQSPIGLIVNSYDFFKEGIYTPFKLIKRTAFSFNKPVIQTYLENKHAKDAPVIAFGKPVTGGAVRGRMVISKDSISRFEGPLIFLTESNVPPDVIMKVKRFAGYISKEGGITSHAALVAIGERKPCITDVQWEKDQVKGSFIIGGTKLQEGDYITMDANNGTIYREDIPIIASRIRDDQFGEITGEIIHVIDDLISE